MTCSVSSQPCCICVAQVEKSNSVCGSHCTHTLAMPAQRGLLTAADCISPMSSRYTGALFAWKGCLSEVLHAAGSSAVCMGFPRPPPSLPCPISQQQPPQLTHACICEQLRSSLSCCPPPFPWGPFPFAAQGNYSSVLLQLSDIERQHLPLLCRATTVMCLCT